MDKTQMNREISSLLGPPRFIITAQNVNTNMVQNIIKTQNVNTKPTNTVQNVEKTQIRYKI